MEHHCRVARFTIKASGVTVEVMDTEATSRRLMKLLSRDIRFMLDRGWLNKATGYGLVVWTGRGVTNTALRVAGGAVSYGDAPRVAQTALQDHVTRGNALDDVMDQLFPQRRG